MTGFNLNTVKFLAFLIVLVFLFQACEEERPTRLSAEQRSIQDSIITVYLQESSVRADSICDERFDRLVRHYHDSILHVRLDEIRKLQQRR